MFSRFLPLAAIATLFLAPGAHARKIDEVLRPGAKPSPAEYDKAIAEAQTQIDNLRAGEKPLREELRLIEAHHYPEISPDILNYVVDHICNETKYPLNWCRKHDCHIDRASAADLCLTVFQSECETAMRKGYKHEWANQIFICPSVKRQTTQEVLDSKEELIIDLQEKQGKAAALRDKALHLSAGPEEGEERTTKAVNVITEGDPKGERPRPPATRRLAE
jgi:hypothetical protein